MPQLKVVIMEVHVGDDIFKVVKYELLCAGNWPLTKNWSKQWRFWYKLYSFALNFMVYYTAISVSINLLKNILIQKEFEKVVELTSFAFFILLISLKVYCYQGEELGSLIQEGTNSANMASTNYIAVAEPYINYCNFLSYALLTTSAALTTVHALYKNILIEDYKKTHPGEDPIHILTFWYPFNCSEHLAWACILDWLTSVIVAYNNVVMQTLITLLILHIAAELKVLKYNLENFHYENTEARTLANQRMALRRLNELIREHQRLIRYVERLNNLTKYLLLVEYNVTCLMIAPVILQVLKGKKLFFNIPYIMVLTSQLLFLCCHANEIRLQSVDVAEGIYGSEWYQYSRNVQLSVQIVMMRSVKPLALTIGSFGPITAEMALERMKLAYSCVSIFSGTGFSG